MDFDSSSKFIGSLAKFLQSLCNGYVEFDKGVEVIGHIYLSVDSNTGKKIDYVLNEKVCKNDNSVTFISNSFHAQPAEKPKPTPKKSDIDKRNDDSTVVMDESGQAIPNSTNVGTMGASAMRIRGSQDDSFSPGSKRPRSPLHHRSGGGGRGPSSPASRPGVSRYDSGGPAKMARSDIPYSSGNPMNSNNEDYDYQEEDNYPTNFLNQDDQNSSQDVDQKPIIDPDISIVKEEHMASQQANTQNPLVYSHSSGPGRGKAPPVMPQSPYQMMPSPSLGSHVSDTYTGSSLEGADPSNLTRAQQEELEMYYRKGTDQHLTFLRNMREAHAMYPFTGKRDKELFDKALAELMNRLPMLGTDPYRLSTIFLHVCRSRINMRLHRSKQRLCQFRSPEHGMRGKGYGHHSFAGHQGYPYSPGYHNRSGYPSPMHGGRHLSEGAEGYPMGSEENYSYQQLASDDSRDTQHSTGDLAQQQTGFSGSFGDGSGQGDSSYSQDKSPNNEFGPTDQVKSPPDIKYEITPMPFIKPDEFELIEIDPDEEEDI